MCKSLGDFIVAYTGSLGKVVAINNITQNRGGLYYCDYNALPRTYICVLDTRFMADGVVPRLVLQSITRCFPVSMQANVNRS